LTHASIPLCVGNSRAPAPRAGANWRVALEGLGTVSERAPDASPGTQISILGVPAATIKSVTVTGSSSGLHAGHLESYRSEAGASFLLDRPLT